MNTTTTLFASCLDKRSILSISKRCILTSMPRQTKFSSKLQEILYKDRPFNTTRIAFIELEPNRPSNHRFNIYIYICINNGDRRDARRRSIYVSIETWSNYLSISIEINDIQRLWTHFEHRTMHIIMDHHASAYVPLCVVLTSIIFVAFALGHISKWMRSRRSMMVIRCVLCDCYDTQLVQMKYQYIAAPYRRIDTYMWISPYLFGSWWGWE